MKKNKELSHAAGSGDLKLVRALLKEDSSLAKDWQPITNACFFGHVEVVALLLEKGADPNVLSKSSHRYRPLHRVVEHKKTLPRGPEHLEIVKMLLKKGADPLLRATCNGHTAIAVAAIGGETQFLPMLREKSPAEHDIFMASVLGNEKRVKALLTKNGGAATTADENGWTALRYVAASRIGGQDGKIARGLLSIAEALLAAGADPSHVLDQACWSGNLAMVEILLKHGGKLRMVTPSTPRLRRPVPVARFARGARR